MIRQPFSDLTMSKTLSIVLPCYNESRSIPLILDRFSQVLDRNDIEVIFVNNGSTDNSQQVLEELLPKYSFARCVHVAVNQGYGYGLYCGLQAGLGRYLGWTHADMQTDPLDVLRAIRLIEASPSKSTTFVKGLRIGRSWVDQVFTIGMSCFASMILMTPLWDINAQPNIFPRTFLERFDNPPCDFSFDLFYYFMAVRSGFQICRFEVTFGERIYGHSHWNINWQAKLRFVKRTIDFTFALRRRIGKESRFFAPSRS